MSRAPSYKIKLEHTIIPGLRKVLEEIQAWPEIQRIIPARISPTKGGGNHVIRVQYPTNTGLKCLAKFGSSVQELFFITKEPEILRQRLEKYFA